MQTDQRRRARRRERRRRRRQSDDPATPGDSDVVSAATGVVDAESDVGENDVTGAAETDTAGGDVTADDTTASAGAADRDEDHAVAVVLERLIWTIMSSFSLLLAGGAAMLAVRTDGPAAVGLALAAVVVAVSAAYFLYHMWQAPEDAQEF